MDKAERIRAYYQELDEKQDDVIRKLELPESDDYSPSVEAAIIESTNMKIQMPSGKSQLVHSR